MDQKNFILGQSIHRIDAVGKVTGETPYPGDIDLEGQLWMKVRFTDRVHARVTAIGTSRAEAYPGVIAVYTAKDVPVNEYGLGIFDQPVLCGPGSAKPDGDIVRCVSDYVAVVVAETEKIAAEAVKLIDITYEDLPIVTDVEEAMKDGAPQLHASVKNNILTHHRIRHGDMAAGWAQAEVIVEGEYRTGYQEHAYLQPEAGLGYLDEEGRVTVVVAGQWVHEDQEQVAHALGLPLDQVRIIYPAIGGAFGGREDMSVQIILALASWKLERPVKIIWSREESIVGHHKRHPMILRTKWGATREGRVVAAEATVIADAGAYAYTTPKVLGNANLMVVGPYEIPNVKVDSFGVYTNNIPTGAFRGFGGPQGAFAAENQMNKLAELLGMDPIELRLKNVLREGAIFCTGTPFPPGVTMDRVLENGALESDYWDRVGATWQKRPVAQPLDGSKRRGVGVAMGFKNIGFSFGAPEQNWATVEIHGDGQIERVVVHQAGADVGQGAHTIFVQMAAEVIGVPVEMVELLGHDTATNGTSGSSSASRMTFMAGNAIKGAAEMALKKWQDEERPAFATYQYRPPATTPLDPETGECKPNFSYGYMAQFVEVEVDVETGFVEVVRVVSAHDVGKALNPMLVEGQVEGAVVQALGYAVMENLVTKDGKVLNPYLSTYLIPTIWDIPREVKSVIFEYGDPEGPWGARGMAEMPFISFAPAITAAIHDATGVWIDQIPLLPDRVVTHMRTHGLGVI
ncbi:MAG TPA: xanthine dehydrogenase family protein molybdopterin-binding subunit [Aggregatilinea sp.]|uniref:xanthine dehydrogenase family protein molybdopterin-binding subunit n=1 Tax=Aggregatilinea sp. TaxID=2806333 RepID=UPI002CCF7136|nr:xanthine dehydrogenase family protein molybdopterin-binding subunit [Aggregatilinea sp.]HML24377.1 xanthine dehydrogenase family protein molybdopterin-binding subunit [Aggregatilinea sp.]